MPDKKSKPVPTTKKPSVKKAKESKADMFKRLAKARVQNVLRCLRILSNCSSRANYEYTNEQVESMFQSIQLALNNAEAKFTPSKTEQESFEF